MFLPCIFASLFILTVLLLIDCGANVDARASHLNQFATMGSIYMEQVMGIKNPKVAIVNIGAEEEKGNALVKETFPLLQANKDINFVGNIEAKKYSGRGCRCYCLRGFCRECYFKTV